MIANQLIKQGEDVVVSSGGRTFACQSSIKTSATAGQDADAHSLRTRTRAAKATISSASNSPDAAAAYGSGDVCGKSVKGELWALFLRVNKSLEK